MLEIYPGSVTHFNSEIVSLYLFSCGDCNMFTILSVFSSGFHISRTSHSGAYEVPIIHLCRLTVLLQVYSE